MKIVLSFANLGDFDDHKQTATLPTTPYPPPAHCRLRTAAGSAGRALARANNSLPPQASERLVLIPADRTNAGLSRPVYSLVVAGHNNTEAARRATRRRACLDGRPAGAGSRPWQAERARGGGDARGGDGARAE